ncbi:hypothetical protein KUC3_28880 [Alteromonas sp. KC3]|uniref:hypothetical protein n=1 Tax=unclassified Alteromonas TaxID=2614992 RepID=UPI0019246B1C|nr:MULTISPECIES: hypothetical protein [unclassified Alteromonas]BCO20031.1 hypothetical protein KUC3_28880 [Alteromonas sp. KC3]BCO23996.1 hypothetical protein KUC14_28650 [Alteromonas sp. KC14]
MRRLTLVKRAMFLLLSLLSITYIFVFEAKAESSMRIEVEVYDGPLSKTLDIQKAELIGTLNLSSHVTENMIRAIHLSECRLGCFGTSAAGINGDLLKQCSPSTFEDSQLITPDILQSLSELKKRTSSEITSDSASPDKVLYAQYNEDFTKMLATILPRKKNRRLSILELDSEPPYDQDIHDLFNLDFLDYHDSFVIPTKNEDAVHQVCPQLFDVKHNLLNVLAYMHKSLNFDTSKSMLQCRRYLLDTDTNNTPKAQECLTKMANLGQLLSQGAEHWATTQVAVLPNSRRARIEIARAAIIAAELGSEITARADAIARQQKGESAYELMPTSFYLRDSEATDYLNLFEWLDATPRKDKKWPTKSRTRMIERLINDNNWSMVNTAFARGDGKTSMVFVKDDIGNWNLKSYDNDPSDMLNNYQKIGTNLLNSAAKLAKGVSGGEDILINLAGIKNSTEEAQGLLFGNASNSGSSGLSENLESEVRSRITATYHKYAALIKAADNRKLTLSKQVREVDELLESKIKEFEEYSTQKQERENSIAVSQSELRQKQIELKEIQSLLAKEDPKTLQTLGNYNQISESIIQYKSDILSQTEELDSFIVNNSEKEQQLLELKERKQHLSEEQQSNENTIERLPFEAVAVIEQILQMHQLNITAIKNSFVEAKVE